MGTVLFYLGEGLLEFGDLVGGEGFLETQLVLLVAEDEFSRFDEGFVDEVHEDGHAVGAWGAVIDEVELEVF